MFLLGIESWDNFKRGSALLVGWGGYDFFGLMLGVVAAMSIGTYSRYTEAFPVFTTSQVVEGPQVVAFIIARPESNGECPLC
jgi:hypothetical protein